MTNKEIDRLMLRISELEAERDALTAEVVLAKEAVKLANSQVESLIVLCKLAQKQTARDKSA